MFINNMLAIKMYDVRLISYKILFFKTRNIFCLFSRKGKGNLGNIVLKHSASTFFSAVYALCLLAKVKIMETK